MNEGWSGGVEPAGKELSGDRGGVYVLAGWRVGCAGVEGGLVLCFVKRALSFLEVAGLSGNRRAAT